MDFAAYSVTISPQAPFPTDFVTLPVSGKSPPFRLTPSHNGRRACPALHRKSHRVLHSKYAQATSPPCRRASLAGRTVGDIRCPDLIRRRRCKVAIQQILRHRQAVPRVRRHLVAPLVAGVNTMLAHQSFHAFLRFLIAEGKCAVNLADAVPVVAQWKLSSLPRYLQSEDVERVIASCDIGSPIGRRDRAILLLLARLGFRAGDIVQIQLGDIDWKGAWLSVTGKSRRQTKFPLTQEVGHRVHHDNTDLRQSRSSNTATDCPTMAGGAAMIVDLVETYCYAPCVRV